MPSGRTNWAWGNSPMLKSKLAPGHSDHCARRICIAWSVRPLVWREARPERVRLGAFEGSWTWCEGINDLSRELGKLGVEFPWVGGMLHREGQG